LYFSCNRKPQNNPLLQFFNTIGARKGEVIIVFKINSNYFLIPGNANEMEAARNEKFETWKFKIMNRPIHFDLLNTKYTKQSHFFLRLVICRHETTKFYYFHTSLFRLFTQIVFIGGWNSLIARNAIPSKFKFNKYRFFVFRVCCAIR